MRHVPHRSFVEMRHLLFLPACCTLLVSFAPHELPLRNANDVVHDSIPAVNRRIVEYVQSQMGKKVDRGECWDLAAGALNTAGATWDGFYGFGTVVDWRKHDVLPGDIIQFENVSVEHRTETSIHRDTYGKHTAIVFQVQARGVFVIAHQNFEDVRKVTTADLRMADLRGGKLVFYRPVGD